MTDHSGLKPYDVEVSILAGRDEVWAAVTRPEVLRQWFGWQYDGIEAEIQQIFVEAAAPLGAARMGWADGSYLDVQADGDFARVRAARGGPEAPGRRDTDDAADADDRYDAIEEAWRAFLLQLRFLLERRPEGQRRTLYLTGEATWPEVLAFGTPHELDGWQRFGTRLAWAVDDDHLVVAAGRLAMDDTDVGGMEVTISTYGMSDEDFEKFRSHWAGRWEPVARDAEVTTAADPSPNA